MSRERGFYMSSEEIADEIQREGLKENIPYYADVIEAYADKIGDAYIRQSLKKLEEEVEDLQPDNDECDYHDAIHDVLVIIGFYKNRTDSG